MNIYVDFDDCLCETARYFSKLLAEMFGKNVPYEEINYFNLQESFSLTDEDYDRMMTWAHKPEELLSIEETPGAVSTVNGWIDEGHDVSVITGRPLFAYEASRKWLDQHGLERVKLYCLDKYGRKNFIKDSSYSLQLEDYYKMTFDLAVEDSPLAFRFFEHLPELRVMVIDRPWNREGELPSDKYHRVFNWEEIRSLSEEMSGPVLSDKVSWKKHLTDGSTSSVKTEVIVENFTEVSINGKPAFTLSCTPNHLKELVVGRLYTERLIGSVDDIAHLFICGEGNIAEVTLKENVEYKPFSGVEPTCCTGNRQYVDGVRELAPVSQVSVNPETVFELVNHFSEDGKLHKSTGGTHSCYIHFGDGEVASFEDIGRHNALDKAVGHMLLNNKEAEGCVLFTTGRVAADMVIKTVASGIPVLVSKAVPTTKALSLAKKYGLKLICKAWPDSYLEME